MKNIKNIDSFIIDCHTHVGISFNNYLEYAYPYAMSLEDLIVRMDLLGIAYSAVFPFESSYYPLPGSDTPASSTAVSRYPYEKENHNLLKEVYEIFPEHSNRLFPFVMFDPSRETSKQAENLENLRKKYKFFGLKTVTTYNKGFVKDFLKPNNRIRDFAIEHKLPLTFHCSWHKNDIWANVFDVLEVVEKTPQLKFCLAHSARFSKEALDRANALPNCFVDTSAFMFHCHFANVNGEAIAEPEKRFDADYSCPSKVLQALAEAYPETILWGSDTPYHNFVQKYTDSTGEVIDFRFRTAYDDEIKPLKALPPRFIKKIAYENTLNYLSLRDIDR